MKKHFFALFVLLEEISALCKICYGLQLISKQLAALRKDKANLIEIAKRKGRIEPKIYIKDIFLVSGEDDDEHSQASTFSLDTFADMDPEEVELVMTYTKYSRNKARV
ncbi:predicted protein [Chaetoceros tenuissimus]|uniref:Uncharacterized protein n=1 Tax=Chaetoceros tenuissimus TaxID=426638 RepID=A0AAD3DC87_9STRA|nr:predicted protein [Chaetoceros tenuissimus]